MSRLVLESALQQGVGDCSVMEGGYKSCWRFMASVKASLCCSTALGTLICNKRARAAQGEEKPLIATVLCDLVIDNEIKGSQLQLVGLLCCPVQRWLKSFRSQKEVGVVP